MENLSPTKQRARIFISYKRNVEPDEPVAIAVFEALSKHYDVFIDRTMLVGALWAKLIDEEIAHADFLITFLSEHSIQSEMVQGEYDKDDLVAGLCQILRRNTCDDETVFFRLRGAGLAQRAGQAAQMRCQLYADYFRERLKCR